MDGATLVTLVVALLALAGTITTGVLTYRASRQATGVTDRANRDSALLKWAEQLQASEKAAKDSEAAARKEARESEDRADRIKEAADAELENLREKFDRIQIQLEMATAATARLTDTLLSVALEVWRPEPDIPALRRLVGRPQPPGMNGRS